MSTWCNVAFCTICRVLVIGCDDTYPHDCPGDEDDVGAGATVLPTRLATSVLMLCDISAVTDG